MANPRSITGGRIESSLRASVSVVKSRPVSTHRAQT
jgi:hypothetical protein